MKALCCILKNKWLCIVFLTVILQQILVAAGTFFLGEVVSQFPSRGFQEHLAVILFICIFLPGTFIHYGVDWCTVRASKLAQLNYLNEYIQTNYNHPTHWHNQTSKHQRHDIMCRGGQETIQATVYFLVDVVATSLNIIFNTVSIILVTDVTLGITIVTAGLLGLGIIHLFGNKIAISSRDEMLADNQLNAHLSRSWDNIVLGNEVFYQRWKGCFTALFIDSEKAALETVKKREWAITLAGMVTNGLVLGYALLLAWMNQKHASFVLAILVMLPRSLQIVMHIQIVQTYVARWKALSEKLSVTSESLIKPPSYDLSSFVQKNNISIKMGEQTFSTNDIDQFLVQGKVGRYTITGPNGAGKSSLLLNIKNKLSTSATYLPAQHQLMLQENKLGLSTGEIALAALNDVKLEKCGVLLLDEWDANLSSENRNILDQLIDQLSLKRIVVEIRHSVETLNNQR